MTSSDLKQERSVFHWSISTFLQLVVSTTICGNLKFSCGFMAEASPGRLAKVQLQKIIRALNRILNSWELNTGASWGWCWLFNTNLQFFFLWKLCLKNTSYRKNNLIYGIRQQEVLFQNKVNSFVVSIYNNSKSLYRCVFFDSFFYNETVNVQKQGFQISTFSYLKSLLNIAFY